MKDILIILFFITSLNLQGFTQDRFIFKCEYKPGYTYKNQKEQIDTTIIKFIGTREFLQKLKEKGLDSVNTKTNIDSIEIIYHTGKLTKHNDFPITIEYSKTKDKEMLGTKFYGYVMSPNLLTIDSISSSIMDEDFKKTLLSAIQSSFLQISFPERVLKIGDEFIAEQPLTFPAGKTLVEMVLKTKYRLNNISNNLADFDIMISYSLNTTISGHNIVASGYGDGKLVFDMINNFPIKQETNSKIEMTIPAYNYAYTLKLIIFSKLKEITIITKY